MSLLIQYDSAWHWSWLMDLLIDRSSCFRLTGRAIHRKVVERNDISTINKELTSLIHARKRELILREMSKFCTMFIADVIAVTIIFLFCIYLSKLFWKDSEIWRHAHTFWNYYNLVKIFQTMGVYLGKSSWLLMIFFSTYPYIDCEFQKYFIWVYYFYSTYREIIFLQFLWNISEVHRSYSWLSSQGSFLVSGTNWGTAMDAGDQTTVIHLCA